MASQPSTSSSCPASCSPTAASPSSSSSAAEMERAAGDSYIGSVVSLTSKSGIRYEGVVSSVDARESTLGLRNVRSYGSEVCKKDGLQIPPSDKIYEYILFRGSDIKDLKVKATPLSSQAISHVRNNPAIIQSQYAAVPSGSVSSASVGGGSTIDQDMHATSSALVKQALKDPVASPYQTEANVCLRGPCALANAKDSSVQVHSSIDFFPARQTIFNPLTRLPVTSGNQKYSQHHEIPVHSDTNIPNLPEQSAPSKVTSNLNCSSFSKSNTDCISPSISGNASLLSQPLSYKTMSPFASSDLEIDASVNLLYNRVCPPQASISSVSSVPFSSSSILGPVCSPPLAGYPTMLTPSQLTQSAPITLSTQSTYPEPKYVDFPLPTTSRLSTSASVTPSQAPLLPLPLPSEQFTEEFDFVAMNERFNKDEVWGSLGKAVIRSKAGGGVEDNPNATVCEGGLRRATTFNHVYNKDDFFDTLSCNSHKHGGWSGSNKLYERMKTDTETFGGFQRRPSFVDSNNGSVDCGNYAVSYRGRGYGHQGFRRHGYPLPF